MAPCPPQNILGSVLSPTFGRDVSPGDCRIWPARGYAGEADVAALVDGDVRRDLGDFRRHCDDTKKEMNIQLTQISNCG